ncbi:hypothetical protein [Streptomyces hainanensis]|uniref:Uncharacterized protein n=1 Tax=Streptomyces hainanensis TaxID=402648 RepID=A0A4R4SFG6_9ACTN|nr:hypothetical protein [Streptomyces hainanensis]TDC62127.1 hypothetical protein E1283_34630 [Streptomyces hainanensis]
MAMVGLFWITEDSVYLGARPVGGASGVRLTEGGVEALGDDHGTSWSWPEVRRIDVRDVAVRSAARRFLSMTFETVYAAISGDGELPPHFTVRVETADDAGEVDVTSAVAGGIYTTGEYELSRALLDRLADGGATVRDLLAWRHDHASGDTPPREEREALLRKWAEA